MNVNRPCLSLTAILVYRVFRNESKRNIKVLHAVLHLLALIISIVGKACVGVCLWTRLVVLALSP